MSNINFAHWLLDQINSRGWTQADLARASNLTTAGISRILAGTRGPGTEACTGIAKALNLPVSYVFQQAGLLPPEPELDAPAGLITWLDNELHKRGWTVEMAASYAGLPTSFIERIVSDKKRPSFEAARALAKAFGMSDILMLEIAGLLPPSEKNSFSVGGTAWNYYANQLNDDEAEKAIEYFRFLINLREKPNS